jgi:hypothetical protein
MDIEKLSGMKVSTLILSVAALISVGAFLLWYFPLEATLLQKVISLAFFAAVSYSTGYSVTGGIRFTKDSLEITFMRLGIGLAALPLIFIAFNTLHIPLSWWVVLAICGAYPVYSACRSRLSKPRISVDVHSALAFLTAAIVFTLALAGSFVYPYLEDGDAWEHAAGTKYISLMHTYTQPPGVYVAHYLPPYPPTYDVLMGLIHELNTHIQWTLKAFNAILIGLTIVFAYYFVREYTSSSEIALFSSVFLAVQPAFGSHAIWSHTLAITALYPLFYCVHKARDNPSLYKTSILLLGSTMVIQPLMSMVIGLFYCLYLLSHAAWDRRMMRNLFIVGLSGLLLSLIFWIPAIRTPGAGVVNLDGVGKGLSELNIRFGFEDDNNAPGIFDILVPKTGGDLFMQEGYGFIFCTLMILGIMHMVREYLLEPRYFQSRRWLLTSFLWLVLAFVGLESRRLPLWIYPHRFWGILPIGGVIIAAYATVELLGNARKYGLTRKNASFLIVGLVILTSWPSKLVAQTEPWPSDIGVLLGGKIQNYVMLISLPQNTMVYPLCMDDKYSIGMDKMSLPWDPEVVAYRKAEKLGTPEELLSFLRSKGYEYVITESYCIKRCVDERVDAGGNQSQALENCSAEFTTFLRGIVLDSRFSRIYYDDKGAVFKII